MTYAAAVWALLDAAYRACYAVGWVGLVSSRGRRWWLASALVATAALTVLGLLSTTSIICRVIVG